MSPFPFPFLLLLVLQSSSVASQAPTVTRTILPRADEQPPATSELVVGTNPAVTFTPVSDSQFADVTSKITTTDKDQKTVVVYPSGLIWVPKSPAPENPPPVPETAPVPALPSAQSQLVVTASDATVTFAPSKMTQYSDLSSTLTTTDENQHTLIVFPLGLIWAPVGPPPPVLPAIPPGSPPPPPELPKPDDPEPQDPEPTKGEDPATATETEKKTDCTTSTPPPCTKTISYISNNDGFTSTEVGDCPKPSGCVSGEQSTTTTVAGSVPYATATALDNPDDFVPKNAEPLGEETQKFLEDTFSKDGYALDQNVAEPECFKSGWGAPQRDADGTPSVTSKIEEWCTAQDGKEVTKQPKGVDTLFAMYPTSYFSFWLSATNWYQATDESCQDTSKISKDECVKTLTTAMQTCDPNSGVTHGAALTGKCIVYNITLDGTTDPNNPPWNRLPDSKKAQCGEETSIVTYLFWDSLSKKFCDAVDAGDKSKGLEKDLTNADLKKRKIKARTPPPSSSDYEGSSFHFEWSGGTGSCLKECGDVMSDLSGACGHNGGEQNRMQMSGSYDVGCGTYKYSIKTPPTSTAEAPAPDPTETKKEETPLTTLEPSKPTAPTSCYGSGVSCKFYDVSADTAHSVTDKFCDDHASMEGKREGWEAVQDSRNNFGEGNSYNFKVLWKPNCVSTTGETMNLGQPIPEYSCKQAMRDSFDKCNNGGRGGRVEVGCMEYYFHTVNQETFRPNGYCSDRPFGGS
ncbi:MAG: hypothetical protein M1817_000195 [Caeruleum heppii]|nr:MAG: hypothetical protein M1817_000195 [Caeruleum heppii]